MNHAHRGYNQKWRVDSLRPAFYLATIQAMPQQLRFEILFDSAVSAHFASLDSKDRTLILDAIEEQLGFEPAVSTRNRKVLRIPNRLNATWELRCGADNRYRVFYDVDVDAQIVVVLAIGRKIRNKLLIGNEEFTL
ncbi:MAG: type II toxin-antitoxin system RelE/ParE family toxin [Caldilineaceae bacterium]|nr:type II toxin-antitoxin system RelE/ParE family toxin [Caldilineaceae bacterium]